ncbi:extracellular solute-binding protein [Allgaiera indica]|uniref:Peptide/nickel transport system substrate-binding protein n=1 Tax=Allgaiera indica TaxID=765699 RepID=A0A1H3C6X5_9RHOB|nr:extracellular solute-binding protein [Allgaiera indica]SDX49856.1 peptide/nickel transport system substrate-binding protein [Allgaiera indica]
MTPGLFRVLRGLGLAVSLALGAVPVAADQAGQGAQTGGLQIGSGPERGIAMYGTPALPPDFVSLPYANPNAPQGGAIRVGDVSSFDSLNPFTLKGRAPYQLTHLTMQSLMTRSLDEPFTLYPQLAESVRTDASRSWVEFTLNPKARFSDGKPVTVADVLWSFKALAKVNPLYAGAWAKVASATQVGPRTVRFTFNTPDRELPLILGLRPVLEKAQWQGRDLGASGLMVPIGSGPYVVKSFSPGRYIVYQKNPHWWARDLPVNRGRFNFATIRYEYFGDSNAMFESFKAGDLDFYREPSPAKWKTNFNFPAARAGQVVLSEIASRRPSGIQGLVMNTRRPEFKDWRVRQALIDAFNFDFINRTVNGGADPRITSYFSNSPLGMRPGPATGRVRALLEPFKDNLPPGALSGYSLPGSTLSEMDRGAIRKAMKLLAEAGWKVRHGELTDAQGQPFIFTILLSQGQQQAVGAAVSIYVRALRRLGITAHITTVDSAQYVERTDRYDFDMTWYVRALSLSPGNEQMLYWGHDGVTEPGTRNWMGMNSPPAEAMIRTMLDTKDPEEFTAAVRALDRILMAGRYVIPFWYSKVSRIAHSRHLKYPEHLPAYGDWPGFFPDVWWYED